jgi:AraC-like DNA-binding protein
MSQLFSLKQDEAGMAFFPSQLNSVLESFPVLAQFIDGIADWDVPNGDLAKALAIKVLPSTMPLFIVQYRDSVRSSRKFGDASSRHEQYRHIVTKVDTGISTIRPPGPLGAILVRFRPEAAAVFLRERAQCFADAKIDAGDVFNAGEISLLEQQVSEAPGSQERLSAVARFLVSHLRPRHLDPVICRAAACLRRNPCLRVSRLAAELQVSDRHLLRRFQTVLGVGPKEFARFIRIEKALAARRTGTTWVDTAYDCGFADQAHMINDFNSVLGASPERALLPASSEHCHLADDVSSAAISYDYFVW